MFLSVLTADLKKFPVRNLLSVKKDKIILGNS